MSIKEIAKKATLSAGGIVRTADLLSAGLSNMDVARLNNQGFLQRIRHGYYQLAEHPVTSEEMLLKTLIPEGIICMESALFYYGYSDFTPRSWTIAVPRTISRAKLKTPGLTLDVSYRSKDYYIVGQAIGVFNGVSLPIYDKERTICDCFIYRVRLDQESFNNALHAYVSDEQKNLRRLSAYAKKLGVFSKVHELMVVMLHG